jgi:hypothetical protein
VLQVGALIAIEVDVVHSVPPSPLANSCRCAIERSI